MISLCSPPPGSPRWGAGFCTTRRFPSPVRPHRARPGGAPVSALPPHDLTLFAPPGPAPVGRGCLHSQGASRPPFAPTGLAPVEHGSVHYHHSDLTLLAPTGLAPVERGFLHYQGASRPLFAPTGLA